MSKPLLYDVFSGAGGAGHGYQLAGFRVVGIDNRPQPRYKGDGFIQMDAFAFFDAVARGEFEQPSVWHASPPCQAYSVLKSLSSKVHPDLLPATRKALEATGKPWVIENVPGAPIRSGVQLCGTMFGLRVYRHRWFETSMLLMQPHHPEHLAKCDGKKRRSHYQNGGFVTVTGDIGSWAGVAMGVDWMTGNELSQAIPPAYCKFIGEQLMAAIPKPAESIPAPSGDPSGRVIQMGKKSTLPAFLARLRAANPGARFALSEANVALLGSAPDLEAHRRLRDDEALILEQP